MVNLANLPEALAAILPGKESWGESGDNPWVTIAYAQSIDGSIAASPGMPLAISNEASMQITHQLRSRHQAILVGIGTLLVDDPRLNVRLVTGEDPQPVVLDNELRFPLNARLLNGKKPPWIMTSFGASQQREKDLVQAGARIMRPSLGRVSLVDVLRMLKDEGVGSVMVEGGARIITAFLQTRLVDLMVLTLSPLFVGGLHAVTEVLAEGVGREDAASFPSLDFMGVERVEGDLLVWGPLQQQPDKG